MLSEIDIAGVYVAPISVYGLVAVPITLALRWLLWRTRLLGLFWHPSLVTFSLYVTALSLLVIYA